MDDPAPRAGARRCQARPGDCDAPSAPFGVGYPGPYSAKPAARRGYLWHCGAPACLAAALDRRDAAMRKDGLTPPARRADDPRPPPPPEDPARDPAPSAAPAQASLL